MLKKLIAAAGLLLLGTLALAMVYSGARPANNPSTFADVWSAVTVNPTTGLTPEMRFDLAQYGSVGKPKLPQYSSNLQTLESAVSGALEAAAIRTINSSDDYYDYFAKLVHANGICFAGIWEITENSPYSGYFQKGKAGLIIGRISSASPQTTNDENRSFGFAGKIFPTMNPNEAVRTANFFTVDNLNSTPAKHILDQAFDNEPPADLSGILGGAFNPLKRLNEIFSKADFNPARRPLYPISRAGQDAKAQAVTPQWMRIRVAPGMQSATANDADFRAELSAANYPEGLVFLVEVSDTTKDATADAGWQKIGQIRTSSMVTSFGCDRRLHFAHPTLKDPND